MKAKLSSSVERKEISQEEMDVEIYNYYEELADAAKKQLSSKYRETDEKFLNAQLEKHGYVTDNNSEVFVEFNGKCPACEATINENDETCPDCGLKLK
jgi:hypothetical protein